MARFWSDKDANGTPLTDGRVCYVISSDAASTDPNWEPPIYTYGKDREEVFEKLANTTQTAQSQIHRMRKTAGSQAAPPARTAGNPATGADLVTAVADLANPQTAVRGFKTIAKVAGIDVDAQQMRQALVQMSERAVAWEAENPGYPKDPRNDEILLNLAGVRAGGIHRITAEHLDIAFAEAQRKEMFFEPRPSLVPAVHPDGNPDSRTVITATSHQRNRLRAGTPPPAPRGDSAQEAKWRAIRDTGTAAAQEYAIRHDSGYLEWCDRQVAKKSA